MLFVRTFGRICTDTTCIGRICTDRACANRLTATAASCVLSIAVRAVAGGTWSSDETSKSCQKRKLIVVKEYLELWKTDCISVLLNSSLSFTSCNLHCLLLCTYSSVLDKESTGLKVLAFMSI